MNHQHIKALRHLNAQRDFHASMLLSGSQNRAASDSQSAITQIDAQLSQRLQSEYREQDVILDTMLRHGVNALSEAQYGVLRNTLSTTTGSQGGYTVSAPIAVAVADALKQFSSMRRAATNIVTLNGNNMTWPSSDGRTELGEPMAQNSAASALDPVFGSTALNTFKYGSRVITVPIELAQDTAIDFVAYLAGRISARIGRITNAKLTTGVGTTEPLGVVTAVAVGKTGLTGQTTSIVYDDLVDLVASVDPSYRESEKCAWMMSDTTLASIRKLKDTAGLPLNLVTPGIRALGEPDRIFGYPVVTNPDMPAMAANAKSILFGDFRTYIVRDVADLVVNYYDDSMFVTKGQYGYLGMARTGGAYVDIGNAIRAYQNSST